jgi:predicted acetyltransferase
MPMTIPDDPMILVRPAAEHLQSYVAALEAGWSPDNVGGKATADAQREAIAASPEAFLESLDDPEARGAPITLPDGSVIPRLPGFVRWMWDGEFCGSIGFRWAPGGASLPDDVPGHIGYGVVPWKTGRGYASRALRLIVEDAWALGLPYVDLTTDPENSASQKVMLNAGAQLVERFRKPDSFGGGEACRYRIRSPDGRRD